MTMNELTELSKSKKASKLSDKDAYESAKELIALYSDSDEQNKKAIAECLMRFKSTVCLFYFENVMKRGSVDHVLSIYDAIRSSDAYKNNNSHSATTRGFIITAVLIKNKDELAKTVLMQTLELAEKKGTFSESVIKHFNKHITEYCGGLHLLNKLVERHPWNNNKQNERFIAFMQLVSGNLINTTIPPKQDVSEPDKSEKTDSSTKTSHRPEVEIPQGDVKNVPISQKKLKPIREKENSNELLNILSSAKNEAKTLLQVLNEGNGTIANLRNQIITQENRIKQLTLEATDYEKIIESKNENIAAMEKTISEKGIRLSELEEKLRTSRQIDSYSKSQELLTYKSDLIKSLKIEHDDFIISKESDCNPDNYEALLGNLTRVFKVLKRFEISFE